MLNYSCLQQCRHTHAWKNTLQEYSLAEYCNYNSNEAKGYMAPLLYLQPSVESSQSKLKKGVLLKQLLDDQH